MAPLLALLFAAAVALGQPDALPTQPADLASQPAIAQPDSDVQPRSGQPGNVDPVAVVVGPNGAAGPTFDLVAGEPLTLYGNGSTWTSGWQYFRWEFKGCTPPLDTNWATLESTRFIATFTAGKDQHTFNVNQMATTSTCSVDFVVIDNCERKGPGWACFVCVRDGGAGGAGGGGTTY